ncbi:unnamed protein product [Linum tenue]|uniref:Uncharacterized protein n=1 Tax=Linum tenue TaxID=586396 RepID=A0AAV0QEK8_9ROSI|nr:unnamed protein product [Linum tenue]
MTIMIMLTIRLMIVKMICLHWRMLNKTEKLYRADLVHKCETEDLITAAYEQLSSEQHTIL